MWQNESLTNQSPNKLKREFTQIKHEKTTIFEKMNQDKKFAEGFIDATQLKFNLGRIRLLKRCVIILLIFQIMIALFAYNIEYQEIYNFKLYCL